jgi:hypothetical protein
VSNWADALSCRPLLDKVPEKVIAPESSGAFFFTSWIRRAGDARSRADTTLGAYMIYMVREDDEIAGAEGMRPARPQSRMACVRQLADCSAWS